MHRQYTDVIFYKVTGDSSAAASSLMKREGVRAVPSFHFWKNGERVEVVNGANIGTKLISRIHETRFACRRRRCDLERTKVFVTL